MPDPGRLGERLAAARVTLPIRDGRLRVSPAVYNDDGDVDALADVLASA